jgi:CRISPR type III-B/RAMP module-associated protein Cmr5
MENLEQVRAATATKALGHGQNQPFNRSDVVGIPALILGNGLLAAAAFCCEDGKEKRKGMKEVFKSIAIYLNQRELTNAEDGDGLIKDLARKDSLTLQRATAEAMAYLAYLKRFARKKD